MPDNPPDIERLAAECSEQAPQEILRVALGHFPDLAISFSGSEDVALVDMACRIREDVRVFCLDTGRLHAQTLRFMEQVRDKYPIRMEVLYPDHAGVEKMVREKGLFSFHREGHQECCALRKVIPLRRYLAGVDAWVTGQRRDQSPDTRAELPVAQMDHALAQGQKPLFKFNPLANWSSSQVWEYIRSEKVPYNPLHEQGYVSIGCEPCTRALLPNEHERAGRWWWEESTQKECGLHVRDGESSGKA